MGKKRVLGLVLLLVVMGSTSLYAATHPVVVIFQDFINDTVLPFFKIGGLAGILVGVGGLLNAKRTQSENIMTFVWILAISAVALGIAEIANYYLDQAPTTQINLG